jgi:hypothetical protein
MLMRKVRGLHVLALGAGRPRRGDTHRLEARRCYVEPADLPARPLPLARRAPPESFEPSQAQRSVLLGVTPDVEVSQRASKVLAAHREESSHRVWELGHRRGPKRR